MKTPLVSVIVTTFGDPVRLRDAVFSVVNQTYRNFEIIIVDDNGRDSQYQVITEILVHELMGSNKDFKYVVHPVNMNGAAARNTGILNAKGDYLAFLDSDDVYHPKRLERCVFALEALSNSKMRGAYTGCVFYRNSKKYHQHKVVESGSFLAETLACKFKFSSGSNLFIDRKVIDEVGFFDTRFRRHQDYEFLVRYFERYEMLGIREVLLTKHNDNLNLPVVEKMIDIKELYLLKYQSTIEGLAKREKNFVYYSNYVAVSQQGLREGKFSIFYDFMKQATFYKPLNVVDVLKFLYEFFRFCSKGIR